jgi:hypothetical protein
MKEKPNDNAMAMIVNKLGLRGIIYLTISIIIIEIIIIIVVWYKANTTASPGHEVKILWGLVEYTKKGTINANISIDAISESKDITSNKPDKQTEKKQNPNKDHPDIYQHTEGDQSPAINTDSLIVNVPANDKNK